jgi:AraC-like DNA-binding protein
MFIYVILVGFFVSFLILLNYRKTHPANIFLFFYFLINTVYLLVHYAVVYSKNPILIGITFVHLTPFFFLVGPMMYFYVRGLLYDQVKLGKLDLLHFIPAVLFLINIIPYIILPWSNKLNIANLIIQEPSNFLNIQYLYMPTFVSFILRPVTILLYFIVTFVMFYKSELFKNHTEKQAKIIYNWLLLFFILTFIIYICFLIFSFFGILFKSYEVIEKNSWFLIIAMFVGLSVLNSLLFFFPTILYGYPQLDFRLTKNDIKKEARSFEISDDRIQLLSQKLEQYLAEKPYLQQDFSLSKLSMDSNIPVHHLSYYFNEHIGVSFNTWKNNQRIDYVIDIFNKGERKDITLDALSKEVGFGSRSSFINAFKAKTGKTPSEWVNSN